jgi:hypothetical protein
VCRKVRILRSLAPDESATDRLCLSERLEVPLAGSASGVCLVRLTCRCTLQPVFLRIQGVTLTNILDEGWLTAARVIAPHVSLPVTGWALIAELIRFLAERQLRRTLTEIFRQAPGGSVIVIRNRGLGGSVWIQVGPGHVPGCRPGRAELT